MIYKVGKDDTLFHAQMWSQPFPVIKNGSHFFFDSGGKDIPLFEEFKTDLKELPVDDPAVGMILGPNSPKTGVPLRMEAPPVKKKSASKKKKK